MLVWTFAVLQVSDLFFFWSSKSRRKRYINGGRDFLPIKARMLLANLQWQLSYLFLVLIAFWFFFWQACLTFLLVVKLYGAKAVMWRDELKKCEIYLNVWVPKGAKNQKPTFVKSQKTDYLEWEDVKTWNLRL